MTEKEKRKRISDITTAQIVEATMLAIVGTSYIGATPLPAWVGYVFGVVLAVKVAWGYINVLELHIQNDRLYRYL